MRERRERLAWMTILLAFGVFLFLATVIPLSIRSALRSARQELPIFLETTQGQLGVLDVTAQNEPDLDLGLVRQLDLGESVQSDASSVGFLRFMNPDGDVVLTDVQVLPNSNVQVGESADIPRFSFSDDNTIITLSLIEGRVRLKTADYQNRPTNLIISTPQGNINITQSGDYTIEILRDETYLEVNQGMAELHTVGDTLTIDEGESGRISASSIAFKADPNPNLIANGEFTQGLANWDPSNWDIERNDQPIGSIEVLVEESAPRLRIERDGIGAAKVSLTQIVDKDVSQFENMFIELTARINNQFIPICGIQGSECPLAVRIEYLDENGDVHSWQQGFYASGDVGEVFPDPGGSELLDYCPLCALPRLPHERFDNVGVLYFFQSENIIKSLDQVDLPLPKTIINVTILTEGHQFSVELFEIALRAQADSS